MVSIEFDKETEKDVFRLVTMSKEVSLLLHLKLWRLFFFYVNIMMMKRRPLESFGHEALTEIHFLYWGIVL